MNKRGVCYDVGRVMEGLNWRPVFDAQEVHRELEIIRVDLHCNTVRICGQDVDRLVVAGRDALEQGFEVWFSPELWDESPSETLSYVAEAARSAEPLHRDFPGQVVFSVGSELALFMRGILEGDTFSERISSPTFRGRLRTGAHNALLNEFLSNTNAAVRGAFGGAVTYASVPFESVEWRQFDYVSVDLYRDARTKDGFRDLLRRYCSFDQPVAITEFGCCTYRGAAEAGANGWNIIDDSTMPPQLNAAHVRDESEQARELGELLAIFDDAGVDATFVFTFAQPLNVYCDVAAYDFDMPSYSLVKSFGNRLGAAATGPGTLARALPSLPWDLSRSGTTYADMPWEPKESFRAVAEFYASQARRS